MARPRRPPTAAGEGDGNSDELGKLREELAATRAKLDAVIEARDHLSGQVTDIQGKLDAALSQLRDQQGQIGRLQAIADTVADLTADRDRLRNALSQANADTEQQVRDAVEATRAEDAKEREADAAVFAKERKGLKAQIADLERQLAGGGAGAHVAPSELAGQLASVLDRLGEVQPVEGRQFAAALTSLEVEARGSLEAPGEGEDEPRFVPAGATAGLDSGRLSTLRMQFRLMPALPQAAVSEPPPE